MGMGIQPPPSKKRGEQQPPPLFGSVGILPGLNWFCPAQWVKPGLNRIKLGLIGQNWVQGTGFFASHPDYSTQYNALYLSFGTITYP